MFKGGNMFYQITENKDWSAQFDTLPLILIGNENAVFDFANERSSDAYDEIDSMEVAKQWLEENGYKIEEIPDLIQKLEEGQQIFIQ